MKLILISVLLLFALSPEWMTNFEDAKATASKENKMILLNFSGSDWCAPCIKMKRNVFESDSFKNYADQHLVLLRADFPRMKKNQPSKEQVQHNETLAEKYNPQGKFPLTLLLDATGKVIREWDGYSNQSPEDFVTDLQKNKNQ
jgi:thioredoxin-related protein